MKVSYSVTEKHSYILINPIYIYCAHCDCHILLKTFGHAIHMWCAWYKILPFVLQTIRSEFSIQLFIAVKKYSIIFLYRVFWKKHRIIFFHIFFSELLCAHLGAIMQQPFLEHFYINPLIELKITNTNPKLTLN